MLPLEIVRRYAQSQGWVEVQFNEVSKVIGFVRGDQRVNVYWTTGIVIKIWSDVQKSYRTAQVQRVG